MYERFTERARRIMAIAKKEALRLKNPYIGTEHILLAMMKEGTGVGVEALKALGADLKQVCAEAAKLLKAGTEEVASGQHPMTPGAKTAVEYAVQESRELKHDCVDGEHLLLGLMRENDGIAGQVLMGAGIRQDDLRQEILRRR